MKNHKQWLRDKLRDLEMDDAPANCLMFNLFDRMTSGELEALAFFVGAIEEDADRIARKMVDELSTVSVVCTPPTI